jgi:hypothetical protein
VSKHKGKRQKGKSDSSPPSRPAPAAQPPSAATSRESPVAQSAATAAARVESPVESALRVEGNVIHLPAPVAEVSGATNDSSGAHPTPQLEKPVEADVSALREATGERDRTTVPPVEGEAAKAEVAEGEAAKAEGPARSFFDPSMPPPAAKADAPAVAEKKPDEAKVEAPKVEDKKVDAKKPDDKKPEDKKVDTKKTDAKKADPAPAKGPLGRDRKESLSSHLSDEARAFFSEQAYQAAYKTDHDTFEDLVPATEDHARETARSRQWMKISVGVVATIVAVSVGFAAWHSQYAVPETTLLASRSTQPAVVPEALPAPEPTPPPAPEPTPPAATPEPTPPAATPEVQPAPPTPPSAVPPAAVSPTAAPTAVPVPPTAAPTAVPVPPTAAPGEQTPQQLLTAARNFRGAMPGRVAAYETYFNAAPGDDRTMTTFAMSLAEMGRAADAERIANRAVTANANNAQAWFILAFSRKTLRNAEGFREARTRCIALGGQWATECRALQ